MRISDRLKCVADNVSKNSIVADIGCDHAYTSIYLVKNGIAPHVYAMDVNKGPLQRAKENVRLYGYENEITVILSNGLKEVKPEYCIDTVLISGMGGNLMIDILKAGNINNIRYKELILQPQSHIADLRKFLHECCYKIVNEEMVYEESKYYNVIKAVAGTEESYSDIEYEYGKLLIHKKNNVFLDYLKYNYDKNIVIEDKIKSAGGSISDIETLHNANEVIHSLIIKQEG